MCFKLNHKGQTSLTGYTWLDTLLGLVGLVFMGYMLVKGSGG